MDLILIKYLHTLIMTNYTAVVNHGVLHWAFNSQVMTHCFVYGTSKKALFFRKAWSFDFWSRPL